MYIDILVQILRSGEEEYEDDDGNESGSQN